MRLLALILGSFLMWIPAALANPVAIANPSFETLPAGGLTAGTCGASLGCFSLNTPIPGWTVVDPSVAFGQYQPFSTFAFIPNGTTVAYSNDPGATFSQTVGTIAAANVTYTLQVDLGLRSDTGEDSLGTIQLLIGTTAINGTGVAPAAFSGSWSTFTATYTTLASDIGKTLTIQLTATGHQSDFDNVRLNDNLTSAAPEPASALIAGMGLGALALIGHRQRARRNGC